MANLTDILPYLAGVKVIKETYTDTTAPFNFVKDPEDKFYLVKIWSGGGGGATNYDTNNRQYGGAGGAYFETFIIASELADTTACVVGAGGPPGTGGSPTAGGNTSFGDFTVTGGQLNGGSFIDFPEQRILENNGSFLVASFVLDGIYSGGRVASLINDQSVYSGKSFYGGGAGGFSVRRTTDGSIRVSNGGNSIYGGGGGGTTTNFGSPIFTPAATNGGISKFAGNGGNASIGGPGENGSFPSGGGAAGYLGFTGGSGANGQIIVYRFR